MTPASNRARPTRKLWVPFTIIVIAAGMIAFVFWGNPDPAPAVADPVPTATDPAQSAEVGDQPEPGAGVVEEVVEPPVAQRVNVARLDPGDPLAVGGVDAPVTVVMYSDFQCGFCALWSTQTLPTILEYVDAGQVRVEWRDIALFGENSLRAAHAGYAAGLQGQYVPFHQALFPGGDTSSPAGLSTEGLIATAADLGLDAAQFEADLVSAETAAAVQRNVDEAASLGAFSTPAFLINGLPIVGAQPTDAFVNAIEAELAQAS